MRSDNSNASRAASARGFMAFCVMLAMGLGVLARPAEAAPFAYVTNSVTPGPLGDRPATNKVVATSRWRPTPRGRRHPGWDTRLCREFALRQRLGDRTPPPTRWWPRSRWRLTPWDRRHPGRETRLCREFAANTVSVIDTASNTVVATVAVGSNPSGVAVTPDGNTPMSRMKSPTLFR